MIDKETREVVDQQYERVKKLLLQHEEQPMLWREYVSDSFKPVMLKASERRRLLTSVAFRVGIKSAVLKCSKAQRTRLGAASSSSICLQQCLQQEKLRSLTESSFSAPDMTPTLWKVPCLTAWLRQGLNAKETLVYNELVEAHTWVQLPLKLMRFFMP